MQYNTGTENDLIIRKRIQKKNLRALRDVRKEERGADHEPTSKSSSVSGKSRPFQQGSEREGR